ncbi:MAG TPA: metalloregulator ArsR/SmtB family transcription factor [Nitrospirota bacterium]|nr:metalloregulator ArsR/SmtB family transcription factor [Nitrospirota bacterium]
MKNIAQLFWLLSDPTRLRILMLLDRQELCVCQLMGVLGVSQPLISRNLSLLWKEDLLDERRQGKLAFYKVKTALTDPAAKVLGMLRTQLRDDADLAGDLRSLRDCQEFQKKAGTCDMKTFLAFMERQRKKK